MYSPVNADTYITRTREIVRESAKESKSVKEREREKKRARLDARTCLCMFARVRAYARVRDGNVVMFRRAVCMRVCVWEACVVRRHARTRVCVANYVI